MAQLVKRTEVMKSVSDFLLSKSMQEQLAMALPRSGITPQRLVRIVMTEIRKNPDLLACTKESLIGAILQAAQLGLEPGVLGQCWIIPYKTEATFIPGYRGLVQLAWRSSLVKSAAARAVFDGDVFAFDFGTDEITHKPMGETDPAKLVAAWSVLHTTNGGRIWDVMSRREIDAIRARSRAAENGPWVTDYVEMAKKTVLRRMLKMAPCSAEMAVAMSLDDAADAGIPQGLDFVLPEGEDAPGEPIDVTPGAAPAGEVA